MISLSIPEFLGGLSISGATAHTWEAVVDSGRNTIDAILNTSEAELAAIVRDSNVKIGEVNAAKIWKSLHSERVLDCVRGADQWLEKPKSVDWTEAHLDTSLKRDVEGLNVVVTGTGPEGRDTLKAKLKANGAIVQSSVNGKTNLLISSETGTKKALAAARLGVEVVEYSEVF